MKPKYLIIAFAFLAALWSGFWFVAASQFESKLAANLETLADRGFALRYEKLYIKGFPFRLIAEHRGFQATGAG